MNTKTEVFAMPGNETLTVLRDGTGSNQIISVIVRGRGYEHELDHSDPTTVKLLNMMSGYPTDETGERGNEE
jgi:hypothetical protein